MAAESPSESGTQRGTDAGIPSLPGGKSPSPTDHGQPIRSEELLQGSREVHILHGGELYRLTLTRAGKLILHK